MKLKFKSVRLVNFLSFGEASVDLQDSGYTLVSGVNENQSDLATSNGSGKSSIWEAISWCLTGDTIRGAKDVKRIGSESECLVDLVFDVDNDSYRLIRTKDPSNLRLFINGEDRSGKGIRDTEKLLKESLPDLTSSLIGSVVILGQGLPQRFTNNTPAGRKEVLEKLSKSDFMIEDLKERIQNRKKILDTHIRACEDTALSLKTQVSMNTASLERSKNEFDVLQKANYDIDLEGIQNVLATMKAEISSYEEKQKELQEILDADKNKDTELRVQFANIQQTIDYKYKDDIERLKEQQLKTEMQINAVRKELLNMKSQTGTCPTCGRPYDNFHKPDIEGKQKEYDELNASLNLEVKTLTELLQGKEKELQTETEEIKSALTSVRLDYDKTKYDYDKLTSNLRSTQRNYEIKDKERIALELKIQNLESTKQALISKQEELTQELSNLNNKILYNNTEKVKFTDHLDIVNKMNTIVSRDFRGYLLTNVIKYISDKAKEYSQIVFETDKINFALDGNNILISYDEKDYENLSGGEKQKVDLIVQLSIRDMLCKFLNFSSNIIVLDELFDNLDSLGCQKVLSLISDKLSDVESVFIITHHQDIQIPSDKELIIRKGVNGISVVE